MRCGKVKKKEVHAQMWKRQPGVEQGPHEKWVNCGVPFKLRGGVRKGGERGLFQVRRNKLHEGDQEHGGKKQRTGKS